MAKKHPKILYLIERLFIVSIFIILIATLFMGIYFNKYDEQEKRNDNLQKIHRILSQLVVPSLVISDLSEVRHLLYMASGEEETYIVVDNSGTVIMPDYEKSAFYNFANKVFDSVGNCKNLDINYESINGKKYIINCSNLMDNTAVSKTVGALISFTQYQLFSFSPIIFYFLIILILLFLMLIFFFRKIIYRQLLKPLLTLKKHLLEISPHITLNPKINEIKNIPFELVEIKEAFERLLLSLQQEYNGRIEAEKMKALVDIMASVGHDIRSPLATLELCVAESKMYLPEGAILIQIEAIQSIRDIANNLLEKYRNSNTELLNNAMEDDNSVRFVLFSSIIDSMISQKRQEWKKNPREIIFKIESYSKGIWINAVPNDVKRVLSNILNNAYEALPEKENGKIDVILKFTDGKLWVVIADNGVGILPEKIDLVLNGFSSKHQGKGIGLSSAKNYMEKMGGCLTLISKENIGTQVTLKFPFSNNPPWLPENITLNSNDTVVLLDDDQSIHEFWLQKLQDEGISLIQFYSSREFLDWYNKKDTTDDFVFFMDYELRGEILSGLDLLQTINPRRNGYLITSHAEKTTFQKVAEELNIWLLPKSLLSEISLKII